MGDSAIEWTDKTWNPTTGCTRVSEGCRSCYAFALHDQRHAAHKAGKAVPAQYAKPFKELQLFPDRLADPLSWRKPQRVFVNSMSDLFHKDVPDEFIARVFITMREAKRHTFQILTKRPERMLEFVSACRKCEHGWITHNGDNPSSYGGTGFVVGDPDNWPLPNVWLGTSVEDQRAADERIPLLLQTPAAVRFLSCEPLLGPMEFSNVGGRSDCVEQLGKPALAGIDWVIVGGESGPGARPFDVAWARSIVSLCRTVEVPVFVKQIGSLPFDSSEEVCRFESENEWTCKARSWLGGISGGGTKYKQPEKVVCVDAKDRWCEMGRDFMRATTEGTYPVRACPQLRLRDRKGGDPSEWPDGLNVRQFPTITREAQPV